MSHHSEVRQSQMILPLLAAYAASMLGAVLAKVARVLVRPSAYGTDEWALTGMTSQMTRQLCLVLEALLTSLAVVGIVAKRTRECTRVLY